MRDAAPPSQAGAPRDVEGERPVTTAGGDGPGLFLVVEGVEGAGKSTQVAALADWMREAGIDPVVTREPGGTPVGEAVRSVVLDRPELDVPPASELFLILAARAAFFRGVVRPALEADRVVLADRYDLSTLAYQGYGRGLPLDEVRRANALATGGLRPDLTVVLDLPVDEGLARQRREGKRADRMEGGGLDFLERVGLGYRELVDAYEGAERIDASGSPDEVQASVRGLLRRRFPETFTEAGA